MRNMDKGWAMAPLSIARHGSRPMLSTLLCIGLLMFSTHPQAASTTAQLSLTPSGAITSQTLTGVVQPASDDVGKAGYLYVAARTSSGALLLQATDGSWQNFDQVKPAAASSLTLAASSNLAITKGLDLSRLQGTEIFIGYGRGSSASLAFTDMLSSGHADRVHIVAANRFKISSSSVGSDSALPTDFTCDGSSATLPLTWSGAPAGTQSYAVVMHHFPGPGDSHWYWVLYNIPATVQSLVRNTTGIGTLGTNSVNDQTSYSPPCSKGPGTKIYTYTVYALSAAPQFSVPANQVTRAVLLAAIADRTLGLATMDVVYTR